jgi:acyl dehydratase
LPRVRAVTLERAPAAGETLPEYRVRARNVFRHAPNRIHDDSVARRLGYAGGLVAGTSVYSYLTHPLVARLGAAWLARGTARVRFRRPVYEGDQVTVRGRMVGVSGGERAGEVALELEAVTEREGVAATLVAGLAWGAPPVVPEVAAYPAAPLPAARPPATAVALAALDPLGAPAVTLDAATLAAWVADHDEPLALYRGAAALAHPGLLLQQANRALSENVALGPWAHVWSDLAHLDPPGGPARTGDRLATRGRVTRVETRRGRGEVELDLLMVDHAERPLLHVRHAAIYDFGAAG